MGITLKQKRNRNQNHNGIYLAFVCTVVYCILIQVRYQKNAEILPHRQEIDDGPVAPPSHGSFTTTKKKHSTEEQPYDYKFVKVPEDVAIASNQDSTYVASDISKSNPHVTSETGLVQREGSNKIAIFFNTFSGNNTYNARKIITSQLHAINLQPLLDNSSLFYTRIGNLSWEWPESECRGGLSHQQVNPGNNTKELRKKASRICTQIAAVEKGDEMLTLAQVHNYCREPDHEQNKVVYMHSKGTYTVNKNNDQLRTILMRAILSTECLLQDSTMEEDFKCDVCSTRFGFLPFLSYMGNMWVAECSYISKLIPPKKFENSKRKAIEKMRNSTRNVHPRLFETKLDNRTSYLFKESQSYWITRPSWIGIERYAAEHWIGSHPDIVPCEVFASDTNPQLQYGKGIALSKFQPPKLQIIQETMTVNRSMEFWTHNYLMHPWYGKEGRLFEFRELYGKIPKNDSWFYTYWSQYN